MKHLQLIGLIACAAFATGCESTDTAGNSGRAEQREHARRLAAEQQQGSQDESQQNLQNAQRNTINRDGNPMRY
jgi:heat shock protein HslJ